MGKKGLTRPRSCRGGGQDSCYKKTSKGRNQSINQVKQASLFPSLGLFASGKLLHAVYRGLSVSTSHLPCSFHFSRFLLSARVLLACHHHLGSRLFSFVACLPLAPRHFDMHAGTFPFPLARQFYLYLCTCQLSMHVQCPHIRRRLWCFLAISFPDSLDSRQKDMAGGTGHRQIHLVRPSAQPSPPPRHASCLD